jgi:hypothetical protein
MVMGHKAGDGSHSRDEEYDVRRLVETPTDLDKTVRSLMA